MDKTVEVVARRLEEVSIDYAQRNCPFLIGNIRIDVMSAKDVRNVKHDIPIKAGKGSLFLNKSLVSGIRSASVPRCWSICSLGYSGSMHEIAVANTINTTKVSLILFIIGCAN